MNYKTTSLIITILITVGTVAEFLGNGFKNGLGWSIIAIIGWILYAVSHNPPSKEIVTEVEVVTPKHSLEQKLGIPGYKESEEEMAACFNCDFSRNIENRTFVECVKFQHKVYRKNICDEYNS